MERSPSLSHSLLFNLTLLTLGLSGATVSAGPGLLPVGQPEYRFYYDLNHRYEALDLDARDHQVGPYDFDRFALRPGPFDRWRTTSESELQCYLLAAEAFRAVKESDNEGYESIRGGFFGRPFRRLSVYADFVLDEELAQDPEYTGKKWRGFAGDVDQAFAAYTTDKFKAIVGRFGGFWGVRESLIFDPDQKLDGLAYTLRWGKLAVSYRLGQLDGLHPDNYDGDLFQPRYIAAHRFDYHVSNRLRIGLFETVVFGGPGRQLDLFYLNPIIFFHGSQLNEDLNDNTAVGFDFDVNPCDGIELYAQMLVDDIQLDNENRGDKEPDQIGLVAGGYFVGLFPSTDLELQYQRVNNWTFNQMHERNRYLNDREPIGAVRGNDYDRVSLELIHWWRDRLAFSLKLAHMRQGEGRIDAEWTQPWVDAGGDYSEPFPTGVVAKTSTVSLGARGFVTDFLFVDIEAGLDEIKNFGHIDGYDRSLPFIRAYLSGFLMSGLGLE